ncbi:EDD domain protein, DegV family [Fictibacillus solisalsi]|uniref:EDD domain protein, DegV family n=1 Tax=Fictibacillus solisalsi TaxID=459525 RepID=A0A1G9UFF5_9BACL|nr:DegV family protein [Fictibacillus solisalsi]SDM58697.1 EDD domain protein, DegV family [Fictibacillus solisalsi]
MDVQIITDSGCDLPQHIIDEFNITMLPLVVTILDREEYDRKTIQPVQLYNQMREGAAPKTSQVPPLLVREAFQQYAKENTPCVYITLSSGLSGTYQTAELIRQEVMEEFPDAQLSVIDSQCASLGFGLVVYQAAKRAKEGGSFDDVITTAEYCKNHTEHIFTVDDLEYLLRGGRVSKTQAMMGSLLKIKPVLHMKDGKLFPIEKIRGKKKVFGRMIELMKERGTDWGDQIIGISHADDQEAANSLKEMIKAETGCERIMISMIGCAIGSHAGPGTIAMFFMTKPFRDA